MGFSVQEWQRFFPDCVGKFPVSIAVCNLVRPARISIHEFLLLNMSHHTSVYLGENYHRDSQHYW